MNRRRWITRGLWLLGVMLAYPFYAFISKVRYRPPIEFDVSKSLKPGQFHVEKAFVLFETNEGPYALSRTCPHLGCTVQYFEQEKMFVCPCHQSKFSPDGKYISGPAKKDLSRLKVRVAKDGHGYTVLMPKGALL